HLIEYLPRQNMSLIYNSSHDQNGPVHSDYNFASVLLSKLHQPSRWNYPLDNSLSLQVSSNMKQRFLCSLHLAVPAFRLRCCDLFYAKHEPYLAQPRQGLARQIPPHSYPALRRWSYLGNRYMRSPERQVFQEYLFWS